LPHEVSTRRHADVPVRRSMLILFDHVTPKGVARFLSGHTVIRAKDRGWDTLSNGDLLEAAERAGFDVVVTADRSMRYQQNLEGRRIALVVLSTPRWPIVKLHLEKIAAAVNTAAAGSYIEVELSVWPRPDIAR
jgi:hypothetical protein